MSRHHAPGTSFCPNTLKYSAPPSPYLPQPKIRCRHFLLSCSKQKRLVRDFKLAFPQVLVHTRRKSLPSHVERDRKKFIEQRAPLGQGMCLSSQAQNPCFLFLRGVHRRPLAWPSRYGESHYSSWQSGRRHTGGRARPCSSRPGLPPFRTSRGPHPSGRSWRMHEHASKRKPNVPGGRVKG